MKAMVVALVAGLAAGPFLGGATGWGMPLAGVSQVVIQLIKAMAVPLLFVAIINAISQAQVSLRHGIRMFGIAIMNAFVALSIGLGLSHLLKPGAGLRTFWGRHAAAGTDSLPTIPKVDLFQSLGSWFPRSVAQPFVDNAVIPAVLLALLLGMAIRSEGDGAAPVRRAFDIAQRLAERMLFWVTRLIPLAVFAAVASSVAKYGFGPLVELFPYLWVALLGLLIHIALTYQVWVRWVAGIPLPQFWREAKEPVVQALGTNSSLATLPFTLRALDRLGVSRQASALGACIGTNLNNDGIILYEGMAFLFVAQAMGIDLSLGQQLVGAGLCLVTAVGIAGVPEAGFISLALVLGMLGVPTENLALLLSVDWILGRARSVTNVLSDMVVSIGVDDRSSRSSGATFQS